MGRGYLESPSQDIFKGRLAGTVYDPEQGARLYDLVRSFLTLLSHDPIKLKLQASNNMLRKTFC